MDINKKELVNQLHDNYGYTKKLARQIVDDFTDVVMKNMESGNSVSIYGFGCFDLLVREERSCPNPQTGEKVIVPAHYIPRFYPGIGMRVAVKKWEACRDRG